MKGENENEDIFTNVKRYAKELMVDKHKKLPERRAMIIALWDEHSYEISYLGPDDLLRSLSGQVYAGRPTKKKGRNE